MTPPADPTAWAARQVGLPPDATPAEVRAALLREVTRDDFAPPPARQQAWQALCAPPGSRPPYAPEALLAEESRLRGEIDDFGASFFATPVEARRQRWQVLSAACAFSPPLAARLAALQPGLDLDVLHGGIGNPRTEQLASHVAGLFVLAPAARSAQRQAVLRGAQSDIAGWEEAARQLQATFPALAALEPTLLTSILNWREQQRQVTRAREGRQAARRVAKRTAAPAQPAASGGGSGKALGGGVAIAAFVIIRLCIGLAGRPSYTPQPKIEIQRWDPDGAERTRKMLEDMERINRENEERNKRLVRPGDGRPWVDPEGPFVPEGKGKTGPAESAPRQP